MKYTPGDNGKLSTKDRHDAYVSHANFAWKDMDARRNAEWKVSFGIWTALGAYAGFVFRPGLKLSLTALIIVSGLLLTVGVIYTFVWTSGLRDRQIRNLRTAHYFLDLAENELAVKSPRRIANIPSRTIFTNWAHATQIGITFILIAIALFAMWMQTK